MHIRCKFQVRSIERTINTVYNQQTKSYENAELRTIKFNVSYDPEFHGSTPSGVIELSLVREEHARHFKLGAEYYADFSPVLPVDTPASEA